MNSVTDTLAVLSAMITPVVLILASGSLILTTSQRLSRSIERTRKISDRMREMIKSGPGETPSDNELQVLFDQLHIASKRSRLLQKAMSILYFTLFFFIATCITIAVITITRSVYAWLPIAFGVVGISLLFYASIILIKETRIAIHAVQNETDHLLRFFKQRIPALPEKEKAKWWKKIVSFQNKEP
jgi:hypothetical protein